MGGGMNARFYPDGNIILKDAPIKFEAGTPNIEGVIGLGAAAEYLMHLGMENIMAYEKDLRAYFAEKMLHLDNIDFYNPDNETGPITFNSKVFLHRMLQVFWEAEISVSDPVTIVRKFCMT